MTNLMGPMTPTNYNVAAVYRLNGVKSIDACFDLSEKIDNIRRKIKSIEDISTETAALNAKISRLNNAILIAGVVQDTCVGFLDMVAALMPGKTGNVAKAGVWSISTAETASQLAHGQTTIAKAAHKTMSSTVNAVSPKTASGKAAQNVYQNASRVVDLAIASKDGSNIKVESRRIALNTAFEKVELTLDLSNTTDSATKKHIGAGLGLAKAALNYQSSLDKRTDTYFDQKMRSDQSDATSKANSDFAILRITKDLKAALLELEKCGR